MAFLQWSHICITELYMILRKKWRFVKEIVYKWSVNYHFILNIHV